MYYPILCDSKYYSEYKDTLNELDSFLGALSHAARYQIPYDSLNRVLGGDVNITGVILKNLCELKLFRLVYIVECPNCGGPVIKAYAGELMNEINNQEICDYCDFDEFDTITEENIFLAYEVLIEPCNSNSICHDLECKKKHLLQDY